MIEIKFAKLFCDAFIPEQIHIDDAGMDVFAACNGGILPHDYITVGLGIACEFPAEYMLFVQERSGMASKHGIIAIGKVIDSGYRGEIHVGLANFSREYYSFSRGDRIAQIILVKIGSVKISEINEKFLSKTDRGTDGYGSTGK